MARIIDNNLKNETLIKDINEDYFVKYNLTSSNLKDSSNQFVKLTKKEFTSQKQISQAYQAIEQELKRLISKKENLQRQITNLANKPNRTPKEEQDLVNKRKELEELDKKDNNLNTSANIKEPTDWIPWIIGIICLSIAFIIIFFWIRSKKSRK